MKKHRNFRMALYEAFFKPMQRPGCVKVASKNYRTYHFCLGFRKLNPVTFKEQFPISQVEDIIHVLA